MGKARVTPLPKIEEGFQQSTPRSKEIKEARKADAPTKEAAPAEKAAPAREVKAASTEPTEMETEESTAEGLNKTVIQEDVTTDGTDGLIRRDTPD